MFIPNVPTVKRSHAPVEGNKWDADDSVTVTELVFWAIKHARCRALALQEEALGGTSMKPVLSRRLPGPTPEHPMKRAPLGEAERGGNLVQASIRLGDISQCELAPEVARRLRLGVPQRSALSRTPRS
jgi:hypothetical protein